jgi:hypothetical protein
MKNTVILFINTPGGFRMAPTKEITDSLFAASLMKSVGKIVLPGTEGKIVTQEFDNVLVVLGKTFPTNTGAATVYDVAKTILPVIWKKTKTTLGIAQMIFGELVLNSVEERKILAESPVLAEGWFNKFSTVEALVATLITETTFVVVDEDPAGSVWNDTVTMLTGENSNLEVLPETTFGFVEAATPVASLLQTKKFARENNTFVVTETRGLVSTKKILIVPGNATLQDSVLKRTGLTQEVIQGIPVLVGEINGTDLKERLTSSITEAARMGTKITDVVTPELITNRVASVATV